MYSAVSSMPLAATGLVICWNFPMNRARSSHSSLVVIARLLQQQPLDEVEHQRRSPPAPAASRHCTAWSM